MTEEENNQMQAEHHQQELLQQEYLEMQRDKALDKWLDRLNKQMKSGLEIMNNTTQEKV